MAQIGLEKHDIHKQLMQKGMFPCSDIQTPSLNDYVVTKQMFCIILLRLFTFKFHRFLSTVGFSNEDNCCHLQGIRKLIKEKLLKGIFKVE